MNTPRVIALGEILWDMLPEGRLLGGAPANFGYHAHALGADVHIISRVGNDLLGREILQRLAASHLSREGLQLDPLAPTGIVSVDLEADGQPRYVIHEVVAWDGIEATPSAVGLMAHADAVCFGTLAQRGPTSRKSIRALLSVTPAQALRIFDVNLRQNFYTRETIEASLEQANVLKLNETELPVLATMLGLAGSTAEQLAALARGFDLRAVALTLGSGGSVLRVGDRLSSHPGVPVAVRDTIGAGDAFTAVLCLGLLAGWMPERINEQANAVAAFVCSSAGATPELPADLRSLFHG